MVPQKVENKSYSGGALVFWMNQKGSKKEGGFSMSQVSYVSQCYYCGKDTKVLSEKVNDSHDMKTLQLNCGHTITVAVIQSLSRYSTSELKARLRYNKKMVKLRNISKAYRESAEQFILMLEAELKDRGA
jgi:hypothetical protein